MLLMLLHLCDSLFPIGGFAHSDGLEAAVATGRVSSADDLRAWMDEALDETLARVDGPAVLMAWRATVEGRWSDYEALDAELHAMRPSSAARAAGRAMGSRLLKTWEEIHPAGGVEHAGPASPGGSEGTRPASASTLPVAFGLVCAVSGIEARAAVEGYIYTRLASITSSAMRLMPIGQREAHALLASMLARVPAAVDSVERRVVDGEPLGAFTPALDLDAMEQQYLRSRLFLS
jgi:urease accessory protein